MWGDFLVAAAGSTAALAGLVFVALSINLTHVLKLPGVSGRAAETIILLAGALTGTLLALVPDVSPRQLGVLLVVIGALTWGIPTIIQIKAIRDRHYYTVPVAIWRFVLHQSATLPFFAAGLSLLGYLHGGLRWFAAAIILSMIVALFNAWVLLVEIMR